MRVDLCKQWRRYTRARQVKWPDWKIHRPGSSPGSALPSPAYCFASVIVWTEKNVTISDRFICFILTVKRRWRPVFRGRQLKKVVNFFEKKSASGWPGWRIFWPRNDLAPPLCAWSFTQLLNSKTYTTPPSFIERKCEKYAVWTDELSRIH